MADGVLLLVDAFEGPMPQTRFVLQKALELDLFPVVVINKIDKTDARPEEVINEVYDLFFELDAEDHQLDFPIIYASGRNGWAVKNLKDEQVNLSPLLDAIIEKIPAPTILEGHYQIQITALDYSDYVGRIGIGRVYRGKISAGINSVIIKRDGTINKAQIKKMFVFEGIGKKEVQEVECGDICAIVGIDKIDIGDTVTDAENPEPLPIVNIDEPTMSMMFAVNNSPLFGKEGKYVTSRHLRDRLSKELEQNVALRVEETDTSDTFKVSGRGILHLSILIENMRREGYELAVGPPKVIYKEIEGKKTEPIEFLTIDVLEEYAGKVIELASSKRGELLKMEAKGSMTRLEFKIPSRGLIGLRNRILTITAGEAVMHHRFYQYEPFKGSITFRQNGVLISMADGDSTGYAINSLQDRGKFFINPGEYAYTGQIVGENSKDMDIEVNIQRGKKLTNMRASGSDKAIKLTPAIKFSLEEALEYIKDDELVEVTPKSFRIRKLYLDPNVRRRFNMGKETE